MKPTFETIPESEYLKNSGYLKLDLMIKGVRVDPSLVKEKLILEELAIAPSVFGNINLILPDETHVSAPYLEKEVSQSPYRLRKLRGKVFLTKDSAKLEVKLTPHPQFYEDKINDCLKIKDVAQIHGGFVSLSFAGHRYLQPHLPVDHIPCENKVLTVDELIGVLEKIRKNGPLDVISLSCWKDSSLDGGIEQIEEYIRAIKSSFNVLLFVEIHPPKNKEWIDKTYAMGADSVCYHLGDLCSHDEEGKLEVAEHGLEEMAMLKRAVSIFPPGSILCHLTMGNRPYQEVMKDIDELTKIKVLPIITPVSRDYIVKNEIGTDQLAPIFGYVYECAKKQKITMNWFSRLAPFIAPIEGRYFSGDTPKLKLALLNFYQSRLFGGSISAGLSNLRRKLRVKEIKKKK